MVDDAERRYAELMADMKRCYESGDWSDENEGEIEVIDIKL
jgi:hypothetical protein